MQTLRDAWISLSPLGRVVLVVVVAVLLALAMLLGYSLDWLPGLLSGQ